MRRGRRLLAVVAAVVLLAGGCGIPDNSDVTPIGPGLATGASSGDELAPIRNNREDTEDRAQFVRNYLDAAAGDPDGALDRVRRFLSEEAQRTFKPTTVQVIRRLEDPLVNRGTDRITVRVQEVGQLGADGILTPATDTSVKTYELTVGSVTGRTGLFVTGTKPVMLMSDSALQSFYVRRTIYFWNPEHTALVPDIRYLASSVPAEQRPTVVVNWLVDGPAPQLAGAVESLPEGTALNGIVPAASNDRLQINLTDQAVPPNDRGALDRLRRQLMWSLRVDLPRILELKVGHQAQGAWDQSDYLGSNASYRLTADPERFALYRGEIKRLSGSGYATEAVPVLEPAANRNVRAAAFASSSTRTYAAVVTGSAAGQQLRVAAAPTGAQGALTRVPLPAGQIGQPVWAVNPETPAASAVGLVPVGGRLHSFTPGGGARRVDWPGVPGRITAAAVAPDGQRVALIAGGRLYLAVLVGGGDDVQLGPARTLVPTAPMPSITAVDWSSEGWVVVAGLRSQDINRIAVMDFTIDGAQRSERLPDLGTEPIGYLAAYPAAPTSGVTSTRVAYDAGNRAYDAFAGPEEITVSDLADPGPNPPVGVQPTRPFFLR